MRSISGLIIFCVLLMNSSCQKKAQHLWEIVPEYKLLVEFSKKIKPETDLVLTGYGINNHLPKGYEFVNGVANFKVTYSLYKTKNDEISLDQARILLVSVGEALLNEINTNSEIRSELDVYPLTSDFIRIAIHFKDELKIDLGQGVSEVYFSKGKIKYERYEIRDYPNRYPATGKHYIIHEETYAEALEIVKKQGSLIPL